VKAGGPGRDMKSFSVFPLGNILLISIQEEIDDEGIADLLEGISDLVRVRGAHGVIVDLHQVEVVDSYLAQHLAHMAAALDLLRARVVIVGLAVPVVITLLDFGIRFEGVDFALDVEQALAKLGVGAPVGNRGRLQPGA